ncbi:hypothetical protein [Neoroseomonas lacus]|uniref:Uncharacterized protein n=1 Tax=Neoroseomonas lacus TaxID=287609 RepID=A0A917KNZ1_9PROT|nr:hypothetical protein [Neoroseomonas lacus]GGJ22652.1 hypothetical protein GCM10011320_32350 [Neoroseomonas lacus]
MSRTQKILAAALDDIDALPPEVRATLRAGLLRFLGELDVTPMVDDRTGELVMDLEAISRALGMTPEEAMASMRECGADKHARMIPTAHLKPMQ